MTALPPADTARAPSDGLRASAGAAALLSEALKAAGGGRKPSGVGRRHRRGYPRPAKPQIGGNATGRTREGRSTDGSTGCASISSVPDALLGLRLETGGKVAARPENAVGSSS